MFEQARCASDVTPAYPVKAVKMQARSNDNISDAHQTAKIIEWW